MMTELRRFVTEQTNYPPNYPQVVWTEMMWNRLTQRRQKTVAPLSGQPLPLLGATNVQPRLQ